MSLKAQDVYAILNSKIGEGGSGTGGTTNYNDLQNKPKINKINSFILQYILKKIIPFLHYPLLH